MVQLSHPYMTPRKTTALTRWTFVSKMTSLVFNVLSSFIIVFLSRTKHLFISWLQSLCEVILEHKKIKSATVSTLFPSICHEMVRSDGEGNGTPFQYSCLENSMTEEPGRLQSLGSLRVRHDWATSLSRFTFLHWRRKWQSTPLFLPRESQGKGSLESCRICGRTESDTTEAT